MRIEFSTEERRRNAPPRSWCSLIIAILFLLPGGASAHKVSSVSLIAHIDSDENTYLIDAAMEVLPSEDQVLNDEISPEDAARLFAEEYLTVLFDEEESQSELTIEMAVASDEETPEELQRQQVLVKMEGSIPEGAEEFLLYLDPSSPMAVVMVVVKDDRPSRRMQVVLAGEYSRPVNVLPVVDGDPFQASSGQGEAADEESDKPSHEGEEKEGGTGSERTAFSAPTGAFWTGFLDFFAYSILPSLLVLSIFLLTLDRKPAFRQFASFLIGFSVGLALAAWGFLSFSAAVAVGAGLLLAGLSGEALWHRECRWWRYPAAAVAGFTAGILVEGGEGLVAVKKGALETGEVVRRVAGAESALIVTAVVAALLLLVLNRMSCYRKCVIGPLAVLLAAYGIFMAVERFL